MKEILTKTVGIVFLSVICDLLIPEGVMKRYSRLTVGFLMMLVLLEPIDAFIPSMDFESFEYDTYSEEQLLAESDAFVLKKHKENIEQYLRSAYNLTGEIFIEVFADGKIKSVSIKDNLSTENIEKAKKELDCENIRIIEG